MLVECKEKRLIIVRNPSDSMREIRMDRSMIGQFKGMDTRVAGDFTENRTYVRRSWTICNGMYVLKRTCVRFAKF